MTPRCPAPPVAAHRGRARPDLLLEPTVSWPETMTLDLRHLVEVDLELVTGAGAPLGPDDWPLEGEEYVYTCLLDGGGVFDQWAVQDNRVVLHRFGGSYGPARFIVIPQKEGDYSLWLTVLNAGGVPVGSYPLPVSVADPAKPGTDPGSPDDRHVEEVEISLSPTEVSPPAIQAPEPEPEPEPPARAQVPPGPVFEPAPGYRPDGHPEVFTERDEGGDEDSASLRMGEQATVDIPYDELRYDAYAGLPGELAGTALATNGAFVDGAAPDLAPFATADDIPYPDPAEPGPGELPGATRRDGEPPAGDEATRPLLSGERAPARRDRSSPAVVRLTEWYSLIGLRRSRSGSLHPEMVPIFSPGAVRGDRVTFTARCAPSDEHGTVFSVTGESGSERPPELRSTQSAKVPPGIYRVTAELLDPRGNGEVRFHGLPEEPGEERRPWRDILAQLPARVPDSGPAHLIAAIEVSGPERLVGERIEAVRRLFAHVSEQATDFVCYSVITYGPHSVNYNNRDFPEVPVAVPAWAETADDALAVLSQAARRGAAPVGYEYAAQLECVLIDLNRNITGAEGRPVIVTAGGRPAHPSRVDPRTEIIPCRYRNDWALPLSRLRRRNAGISFGSIRDSGGDDQLWSLLGDTAEIAADSAADSVQRFARDLGLVGLTPRLIPLPMFAEHPALRRVSLLP